MNKSVSEPQKNSEPGSSFRSYRELIEALAIALVLAFLFKAFIIELYSIPTGSMASTLMGRHKDVNCKICDFPFQFSASQESNDGADNPRARDQLPRVIAGTCPQCQFTMYVGSDNDVDQRQDHGRFQRLRDLLNAVFVFPEQSQGGVHMSFSGDRIFVNKGLFSYREPSRWHVTVFRYPHRPQINYIKRLIGVPNETVMLRNGQVFAKKDGSDHFEIQRKPLRVLLSMLRPVDDNNFVLPEIHELGWKTRWYSDDPSWQRSDDYRSFTGTSNSFDETSWLKFRYITATTLDWQHLIQGRLPGHAGVPQLVTDSLDYNSSVAHLPSRPLETITVPSFLHDSDVQMYPRNTDGIGLNWVGDLVIRCTLTIEDMEGTIAFRLIKGGIIFQCDLDLAAGNAIFSIPGVPEFEPFSVNVPIHVGRTHDIMFCNVDEEMRLVIDGREIDTQGRGRYDAFSFDGGPLCRDRSPTVLDLEPAAIGVVGNSIRVENLKILRNMYYISVKVGVDGGSSADSMYDLVRSPFRLEHSAFQRDREENIRRILSSSEYFGYFGTTRRREFLLGEDQFLMCGDNSAHSKDSRLWMTDGIPHYVDREHLIGEAFYVFWPRGFRIPGTRLAMIPNFPKMRWID